MINLIPTRARKNILKEYWTRVLSVWMLLLGSAAVVIALLLVPSYVLVTLQSNALSAVAAEARDKSEEYDTSAIQIVDANRRGALLMEQTAELPMTELIALIEALAGEQVAITELRFLHAADGSIEPVTVVGKAATRADLAAYRNALEANNVFDAVNLPISNLAKDIDIPFSMTVTIAGNKPSS